MSQLALTIPTIGQPNSTEDVDVRDNFSLIQTEINGANDTGTLIGTIANRPAASATNKGWFYIATDSTTETRLSRSTGSAWTNAGSTPGTINPFRMPYTYAVQGDIKVPSGEVDFLPPFFISVPAGRTTTLTSARHKINSGTSATVKLQKNGSDITGFTALSVTTTATTTDPTDVALADGDMLALIVTAISGSPKNLSFTIFIEWS